MKSVNYQFIKTAGRILNSRQSRSVILTGNIHDLYCLDDEYVPLVEFITSKWNVSNRIVVVYELNGPIRFIKNEDRDTVRDAWLKWRTGHDANTLAIEKMLSPGKMKSELEQIRKAFDANMMSAVGNPTVALELLRQLCLCSRASVAGKPLLVEDLIIVIEAADMLIPEGEISRMSDADRHRISICRDWFSDPGFMNSDDVVVLLSESRSLVNHRIGQLPQILEVNIPSPDEDNRKHFITWFNGQQPQDRKLKLWGSQQELARFTAGLSIHALMQLLKGSCYEKRKLTLKDVISKVETYIQSQLGEDVVEFKKPSHQLKDVIGFTDLKAFLNKELIPRFKSAGPDALPGAAVCGPIGGGKTFMFEAVAGELDMIVLVLKSIRSQWFGQTDVIFERLRRVLDALAKVLIFVDEADTQFGGVGPETHSTERRLTGKIQAMMSDPRLRGRVIWLLMTARIQLLSPDIRRPGRVGDLIIPILDPEGDDREAFVKWTVESVLKGKLTREQLDKLSELMADFSAATFASLRSELKAKARMSDGDLDIAEIDAIVDDRIPPAIGQTRRYQELQALVNCTRKSLLPKGVTAEDREEWQAEIRRLEARGIR
mgnify:CR=1 FL=1